MVIFLGFFYQNMFYDNLTVNIPTFRRLPQLDLCFAFSDRGSMFVFSSDHFKQLLSIDNTWTADSLLDLGAGDGKITQKMASHFQHVFATEISGQMQKHLRHQGFTVVGIDEWTDRKYDMISCLNLLDRCDKPVTLLKQIRDSLTPDGKLIVASVSPYSPFVEENRSNGNKPSEVMDIQHCTSIEDQINQTVNNIFIPNGFSLVSFSRLPYLCEGDLRNSFYILHDIIFILKPLVT